MASSKTVEKRSHPIAFAAPRIFVLAAAEGPDPSLVHRVAQPETCIGRAPEADFCLPDDQVSSAHLLILVDGPNCYAKDLGSTNGSELNGRPMDRGVAVRLKAFDELKLGQTRLIFMRGEARKGLDTV